VTIIRPRRAGVPEDGVRVADNTPAIYGSLLVTTLVAVQWKADAAPELIGLSLVIGVGVFWLAHAWAEVVNRRIRGSIGFSEAWSIALGEATMLLAVVVPGVLLGLHRFGGVSVDLAIGLALAASLVQLFLWGLAVGRAANESWPVAVGIGLVDFTFGVLIVVLKAVVLH
jgi:hypothetical protein